VGYFCIAYGNLLPSLSVKELKIGEHLTKLKSIVAHFSGHGVQQNHHIQLKSVGFVPFLYVMSRCHIC